MSETSLDTVYKEVKNLKKDVRELKMELREDFELSDWAKRRIKEYKKSKEKVPHRKIKEKFSA